MPRTFAGYDANVAEVSADSVVVPMQPNASGPNKTVRIAVVTIVDKGTAADAGAFVAGMSKAFGTDSAAATAGSATGVFGTDGADVRPSGSPAAATW